MEILNDAVQYGEKFSKLTVCGWKYALAGYEEREEFEICAKIKEAIDGKEDHEVIETPHGLFVQVDPQTGVQVYKI